MLTHQQKLVHLYATCVLLHILSRQGYNDNGVFMAQSVQSIAVVIMTA